MPICRNSLYELSLFGILVQSYKMSVIHVNRPITIINEFQYKNSFESILKVL